MVKTVAPGEIVIPGIGTFPANALPDPFDPRDFEYRPREESLPSEIDPRAGGRRFYVTRQVGRSCTGHAVAAAVNTVLWRDRAGGRSARTADLAMPPVSPYMLHHLAQRYDEYTGEDEAGSSLRGALKGWAYHGVVPETRWPSPHMHPVPDLDDEELLEFARRWTPRAYYRVSPYRPGDLQSAISELHGICAAAVIHDGWVEPVRLTNGRRTISVIRRTVDARPLGGHAFALVGYNDVGFLVQNSWGSDWGEGGFATLPYEDWLDTAYDAWAIRQGVPTTPFTSGRIRTAPTSGVPMVPFVNGRTVIAATGGKLVLAPGPDLERLEMHVVKLGNQGRLSDGSFVSTPAQVDGVFDHMERWHDFWQVHEPGLGRHVVLYAHGGLKSNAFSVADANINWWLNNRIYPLFFAWQSGPAETLMNQLADAIRVRFPPDLGFDVMEAVDRAVELLARRSFRWMWKEMKVNARAACEPISDQGEVMWPPTTPTTQDAMGQMPGASLTVLRLAEYRRRHPDEQVLVHLVGHSAGAIFQAHLLQRLVESGVPVASMALLGPAIRVEQFKDQILPHLGPNGAVRRFVVFNLSDRRELDDACTADRVEVYHKSLLYLVSRALEDRPPGQVEAPLLGMECFFDRPLQPDSGTTLRQAIAHVGGASVFSRSGAPGNSRSDALSHEGLATDPQTMTSVVMRALGWIQPRPENSYQQHDVLRDVTASSGPPAIDQPPPAPEGAREPGEIPLVETAEPIVERPSAPAQEGLSREVTAAPLTGSPTLDTLLELGYTVDPPAAESSRPKADDR